MNKKMTDIMNEMMELSIAMESEKDSAKVAELRAQAETLKNRYETERMVYELSLQNVPAVDVAKQAEADGYAAMMKIANGKKLSEIEAALITGDDAANGENYLVPEDVRVAINELRRDFQSAKDLLTNIKTKALTGKFTFETGVGTGLVNFDDGDNLDNSEVPTFVQKTFTVKHFGKIVPMSNILLGAEKAGLLAYIRVWFVKNAIITENAEIFATLKQGKTAIDLCANGLPAHEGLRNVINMELDPTALIGGVIVTNQTGWNVLQSAKDAVGRPLLKENPVERNKYEYMGLPVERFSDAQLPNVSGSAPYFIGNLKNGAYFIEKEGYQFAVSAHAGFGANQTQMRMIESFCVMQADADDATYVYALADATANQQALLNTPAADAT